MKGKAVRSAAEIEGPVKNGADARAVSRTPSSRWASWAAALHRHGLDLPSVDRHGDPVENGLEVEDQLQHPAQDLAALLGRLAEQSRLREAPVQIKEDGHRLGEAEAALPDGRHLAARVDGQIVGRLVLLLRDLQEVDWYGTFLSSSARWTRHELQLPEAQ
jgi:hypothetical protein